MSEDTSLRFYLIEELERLPYGWSKRIDGAKVRKSWPPTGDQDRSMEGAFRAMGLASAGHRPETSYTTAERIKNDLGDSFRFSVDEMSGDYIFHRRDDACPKCNGRMRVPRRTPAPPARVADFGELKGAVTISWEDCDKHS